MGTVTNLADYRQRKTVESGFRPMTDREWGYYLEIADLGSISLGKRKEAADRCFKIVERLAIFEWLMKKNGGRRSFSQAVQRAQLRQELLELSGEHGFIEFTYWL